MSKHVAWEKPILKRGAHINIKLIQNQKIKTSTVIKKYKTSTMFLSSYRNTRGSLGERGMLWEHEPQASVSTAFSSSPKLSRVFL